MGQHGIVLGIVGSGGDGVITSGEMLVSAAAADGLYAFMLRSLGPQIRGGESSCRVRMSEEPVLTQGDQLDVLVMFGWKNYHQFEEELSLREGVEIFYDAEDELGEDALPIQDSVSRIVHRVPFMKIAKEVAGTSLAKNLVMLGVLTSYYSLPSSGMADMIQQRFSKKGDEIIRANLRAFEAGCEYGNISMRGESAFKLLYTKRAPKLVMDGNETVAFAAMVAGCEFFAGYPITPSSEIMQFLLKEMPKFDRSVLQVEDEMSAMNMLIGASFAGKKAMTATSGPGLSLMTEALGLAVMAELPCVVVDVQRGGPSTGAPTKTEQADLQQALFSTHGDSPKVVLAPTDVADCFDLTVHAFNIAEKYQTPVIMLSDQFLGQRKECLQQRDLAQVTVERRLVPAPETLEGIGSFCRFQMTENGVSPMTYPGLKHGQYLACGLAHDEWGSPTSRHQIHERLHEKRCRKFRKIREEYDLFERYGIEDAPIGVVTWGSSRGAVQEAVETVNREGIAAVSALVPRMLYPLPLDVLKTYFESLDQLLVVELSYTAQFYHYLRSRVDLPDASVVYKRSGCMPFTVDEIYRQILQLAGERRKRDE